MLLKNVILYSSRTTMLWTVCVVMTMLAGCSGNKKAAPLKSNISSLKKVFEKDFMIGTAVTALQIEGKKTAEVEVIKKQFNTVTPENFMKASALQPTWNKYYFDLADQFIKFAKKNRLQINAHALIWHDQLPPFMRHVANSDSVREYFVNYITKVAGRYDGKVYSWDVVNEALNDDGSMRKTIFLNKLGENYVVEAFRLAHDAAPNTKLYYNDYNIEQPKKRAGAIALIKEIQAAGVRIDGVGIQGHWTAGNVPLEDIETSIKQFAALGIEVMFTELDLTVLPNPWNSNTADINASVPGGAGMNPYQNGLPDSVQQILAKSYTDLFTLFLKYKKEISRVTFWGVHDGQSWLNNWPIKGRTNYPLLFDRHLNVKPAFFSVIATKNAS